MMDWFTIMLLVASGVALILVEIIFIPGTTIVGFGGLGLVIGGVVLAYRDLGTRSGTLVLVLSVIICGAVAYISFKAGVWNKFSMHTTNTSKFNDDLKPGLFINDQGLAVSDLRPMGKAEFGNRTFEVKTIGNFVKSGTKVKVIKLDDHNTIFVEPII